MSKLPYNVNYELIWMSVTNVYVHVVAHEYVNLTHLCESGAGNIPLAAGPQEHNSSFPRSELALGVR